MTNSILDILVTLTLKSNHNGKSIAWTKRCYKAQPHVVMLHTHDGTYQCPCDTAKSHAMLCDTFSNMLVLILLPILEYLCYSLSDFQMASTIMMAIT